MVSVVIFDVFFLILLLIGIYLDDCSVILPVKGQLLVAGIGRVGILVISIAVLAGGRIEISGDLTGNLKNKKKNRINKILLDRDDNVVTTYVQLFVPFWR